MKKFIIFLLFMPQLFYGQWVPQVSGTTESLNDVFAVTENLVFAVGDNGTILKTTDGGVNWVQKISGTSFNLKKVQFPSSTIGYIIGSSPFTTQAILLKTIDGGNSWTTIVLSDMIVINDISCVSEDLVYINGNGVNDFKFLKTTNGGINFDIVNVNILSDKKIQFINNQVGYASDVFNILKTIDGGLNWIEINNNGALSLYFFNENVGFINNNNGLYKTFDGGVNYSYLGSSTSNYSGSKLFATTENIVWSSPVECAFDGNPCNTVKCEILQNGQVTRDLGTPTKSIFFINPTTGYVVTRDGEVFKNTTGSMLSNNNFRLGGNKIEIFPNPSGDYVNISFGEKQNELFAINIVDNLGKKTFSNIYQPTENIKIDTKSFSKGIYFLIVSNTKGTQTQKLIIN